MSVFDERPTLPAAGKKLRLRGLLAVALLIGAVLVLTHHPKHLRQTLRQFRGEEAADPGPNRSMASSLTIRRFLLFHPHPKLSASQEAALVASAAGPADDQTQSEALDVLALAQRTNALSSQQAQRALAAALSALRGSPGPMVRLESARLLGHLGDPRGVPALQALQRDSDSKVQSAARKALTRFPK